MVCVIYMLTIIIIIIMINNNNNEVLTKVKLSLMAPSEEYRQLQVSII